MSYLNMNDEKLLPTVVELNTLLADYHVYYQNLRNFHWNILGDNFFELHEKFEELYTDARVKMKCFRDLKHPKAGTDFFLDRYTGKFRIEEEYN